MTEGSRMWVISFLTIMLLTLLSAAPIDIDGDIKKEDVKADNDGMHSHDENVTREGKFFGHNRFDVGNINISGSVAGDDVSIGHKVNIDVHGHTHDHHYHEDDTVIECNEGLRELFKSIDSDKNGLMDVNELLRVCHQNNIQITESLAVRILTLPDKTVGFNMAKFCELLKDCQGTNSVDVIYFLLQPYDKDDPTPVTTPSPPFPYYTDEATKISAATTASPTGGAVGVNKEDPAPIIEGISKQRAITELIGTREKIQEWLCKLMDPSFEKIELISDQEEILIHRMTKATSILQNHDYCRIENGNCEPKQMQTFNSIISKANDLINNYIRIPFMDINGESTAMVSHWLLKEFQEQKQTFDEATVQEIQKLMPESTRVCIPGEISSAACVCRSASINSTYEEHCTANQGCTPHGFCFTVCNTNSCTCENSANEGTENCANGQICINGKCLNECQGKITSECICPDARGFHEYGGQQCPPNTEKDENEEYLCSCSRCYPVGTFFFVFG